MKTSANRALQQFNDRLTRQAQGHSDPLQQSVFNFRVELVASAIDGEDTEECVDEPKEKEHGEGDPPMQSVVFHVRPVAPRQAMAVLRVDAEREKRRDDR